MKQRLVDQHRRLVDGQHRARRALQLQPEEMAELTSPTQMGPGALVQNAYSTLSTKAMYDGLVRDQPNTRQFILSRSGFAGVQRHAATVWSGDVGGTWDNFFKRISAGVQTGFSACPTGPTTSAATRRKAASRTTRSRACRRTAWRRASAPPRT